jgi:PAS domain S-box-containing protein
MAVSFQLSQPSAAPPPDRRGKFRACRNLSGAALRPLDALPRNDTDVDDPSETNGRMYGSGQNLVSIFPGDGEMSGAMRAYDWSATPLGRPEGWSPALKMMVGIVLSSGQPMFLAWGPGRTWFYNDAFTPLLGNKHPRALGRPSMEVWAEARDVLEPLFDQVFAGRAVHMEDFGLMLDRRGRMEEAHFAFSYTPARDEDGKVAGLFGACIETTAQVVAVRTLTAERAQFAQLFDQSPSFMAVLRGPEHRFELLNPAYRQLIAHRDLIGKPVREAVPEVEGQGFFELLDNVYSSGTAFAGTSVPITIQRTPNAEPERRFLDFVYQPIRDADGAVSGIFVEGVDVTDAHDTLDALRHSEAQFRTLSEAMLNHVWTATANGNLDWFNGRVIEFGGLPASELYGSGWAKLVHEEDIAIVAERWASALAMGKPYEAQFRLRRADGAYRWHITRAVALRDAGGAIVRWIGTNTDIEDQKATSQALADLNSTLERQVEERTAKLIAAEETLRQSQKMEAVGQLTGGIAHDFNNLLAAISGSLELLGIRAKAGRFDVIPRYIDAAQAAAKRAAALTQRLLAFSRRQTLDPRPVNANRLIGDMEELIRRTVGPAVSVEVVGAASLWVTLVDPNQLENTLLNLAINARDAMPDGGRMTVETANKWLDDRVARGHDLPPGQYVCLSVSDTGTGMTPDVIERAFEPFFTTKPLGQGTGLGLSMIHGFVRQSGGQVRIYSEVGTGTTISLYLPRHIGAESGSRTDAAVRETNPNYDGHGETVLVVDDEPTVRMLIVDVLVEAGYKVLEAADGPQALRVLQSLSPIGLLITDVGLPGGMNGRQVADAGRMLRPNLKVLFVTGYAENAVVGNGILDSGMEIIAKPFSIDMLGDKIRTMLDG